MDFCKDILDAPKGVTDKDRPAAGSGSRSYGHWRIRYLRAKSSGHHCLFSLFRKLSHSTARITALEIRNLPRRISAIHRNSRVLEAVAIPSYPGGYSTENYAARSKFQDGCSLCIQQLQAANPWVEYLDLQMALEAYSRGVEWGIRNACNEKLNGESSVAA